MSDFHYDLRDLRFNLFDLLKLGELSKNERYAEFDEATIGDVCEFALSQATEIFAPMNAVGDVKGTRLVDGQVITPEGWKDMYDQYVEAGWNGLHQPVEKGGQGCPMAVGIGVQEIFIASNLSFMFIPGLSVGALGIVSEFGTEEQIETYLGRMISGEWTGTMCLTEAGAGTAVPDGKTSATPIEGKEGYFKIKGQKIFISAGDHDVTDNIVHMVLARVEGDPEGSRGISLFIVPKNKFDAKGKVTGSNDVTTVAIEEKLGIHASPTCVLSFGDNDDCEGWLIGEQGGGLKCMFKMMNEARIAVGVQGAATAGLAYLRAVNYAKERVQGTRIQDMRKADAERVAIIEHPDVRRNLLHMKAISEGSRALMLYAAACFDRAEVAADEKERSKWMHQVEILTPIVKAWCSDEGFKATELGIQVFGGYGYCREYGMEQLMRDCKIASIYEGTNGIQALDLLGRKISRGGGVMLMTMLNVINQTLNGPAKDGPFADEVAAVAKARDALATTAMGFGQRMMKGDISYAALHATPFLQMFGDTVVAWLLLRQAMIAQKLYSARLEKYDSDSVELELGEFLTDDNEARFLHGKIATANFFIHQILPRVRSRMASIKSDDRSALDVVL